MFASILRKCRRCGHRVPIDNTQRDHWESDGRWVCRACWLELLEKHTGYTEEELEFAPDAAIEGNDLPF